MQPVGIVVDIAIEIAVVSAKLNAVAWVSHIVFEVMDEPEEDDVHVCSVWIW
jgi:hypothetical protein|tara:strand:- start:150 stop:305 length:156 start_codon:yes stop_codon:yes gene_type:complete